MQSGIEETPIQGMIKNTVYNTLANIMGRLGGLLATVLIARSLLPELFGIYSLVLSIILLAVTAIDSGINGTQVKYVSEALNGHQIKKARTYFKFLLGLRLFISGAISIALFLLARPISLYIFNKPLISTPLQVGAIYLFSSSLLNAFISFTYSTKKVNYILFQEIILQSSKVFLITILLLALKSHSVLLVIFALFVSSLAASLFLFQFMRKRYRNVIFGKKVKIDKKKVLKFLLFLSVTGITTAIFVNITTIILGIIVPSTELIAFYQVALTIVQSSAILITFSGNVILPFFTHLKDREFKDQFNKIFGYSIILSMPATFGLIFIARPFIKLIFGQQYLGAVPPLLILAFTIIETSAGTIFATVIVAKGKPEYQMNISIATSIICVILSVLFIKAFAIINIKYSIIGAAIATLVSGYIAFFSLGIITYKKFKIKPDFSPVYKSLISSLSMFFILLAIDKVFNISFPWAIIEIILGALFYLSFMLLIKGIKKEDFKILKGMIKNRSVRGKHE